MPAKSKKPTPKSTAARYPRRRIAGQGAYTVQTGPWANRGAGLGEAIGSHYGGGVGGKIGSWVGRRLFHYPAKLFGSGSYTMTPGDMSTTERMAPQVPVFTNNNGDDSVVITHREYLGDVITSGTAGGFKIDSFGLNPSEMNTFPWLSNIAYSNYQQYKFDGLAFEFKSFSADALNSTNTALGSVFACINYDYTDDDLASRYEVENTDWSASCKPSESMLIPVECKPRQTSMSGLLYVLNTNNVPTNADPKTYYLGKLWFGTTGFQGTNVNIGSLYVTYKVRLYKPCMVAPNAGALMAMYTRTGYTNASPLGTSMSTTATLADSIGITFLSGTQFKIAKERLVVGQIFQFTHQWSGTSAPGTIVTPVQTSSMQDVFFFSGGTQAYFAAPEGTGGGGLNAMRTYCCKITDNSQDITVTISGAGTLPAGTTSYTLSVTQVCGTPFEKQGIYKP